MKILKKGTVLFGGSNFIFSGWEVEGGTTEEFQKYAVANSKLSYLAKVIGCFQW